MPRKRTGIRPRRKTRSTAATQAVAAEAVAVAREKKAITQQAAKAAISQQRNQILKKIHIYFPARNGTISAPKGLVYSSLNFIREFI